ncbi:MAG: phage shock protein operon transcriptional activator [Pseudomonadota bacterium]
MADHRPEPPPLLGESPAFLAMLAHVSAAAPLERPLLVSGERGAGKELVAARIHFLSSRWDGPFVKVNCAALSEDLLDAELFGVEAGAFTGAVKRRAGRFERADGGTLFLDEIASASARVQEKLLRVIEYGEYERLGGTETLACDVRVIAAANVNLAERAGRGDFRADLLDRLAFDVIAVPPLRERPEDIPLLAAHFGARMATEIEAEFHGFSTHATAALSAHDWPGNVRELRNAVERAVYRWVADDHAGPVDELQLDPFAEGGAQGAELSEKPAAGNPSQTAAALRAPPSAYDFRAFMDREEKRLAAEALAAAGGSQARAARRLGLSYDQMRGLVRKHDLAPQRAS